MKNLDQSTHSWSMVINYVLLNVLYDFVKSHMRHCVLHTFVEDIAFATLLNAISKVPQPLHVVTTVHSNGRFAIRVIVSSCVDARVIIASSGWEGVSGRDH